MSREIKFRAWDSQTGQMFFPSSVSWKDGIMWCCDVLGNNRYETVIEKSELMQFTGLKDINGKEIYEGDVVTACEFYRRKKDLSLDRDESIKYNLKKGIVEWLEYNCSFMIIQRHLNRRCDQWNNSIELRPSEIDTYEIEVIGNIHQNPELLEKTK